MSHKPTPSPASYEHLETLLRALLSEHERLLALAAEQSRAIAHADARALSACIAQQHAATQKISALERQRQTVAAALARPAGAAAKPAPKGAPAPNFSAVTAQAPEPLRSRLNTLVSALRETLNRLHREHTALRSATETLAAHMEGLVRQACQRLSHSGTYARGGALGAAHQVVTSVDLRS